MERSSKKQGLHWLVFIKSFLHVKYEGVVINSVSTTDLLKQIDRQTDRHHHFIDWILLRNAAKNGNLKLK